MEGNNIPNPVDLRKVEWVKENTKSDIYKGWTTNYYEIAAKRHIKPTSYTYEILLYNHVGRLIERVGSMIIDEANDFIAKVQKYENSRMAHK